MIHNTTAVGTMIHNTTAVGTMTHKKLQVFTKWCDCDCNCITRHLERA